MELPENFYKGVEIKGSLKHILYSDSVAEDSLVTIKLKESNCYQCMTFEELWNHLVNVLNCKITTADKDYIFIKDEFKSISYNVQKDTLIQNSPQYIMRHQFNDNISRLNFTGHTHLDITSNHSMLDYDPNKKDLTKKTPNQMIYVPVIRNRHDYNKKYNRNFDIQYLLLGIFIGNGTISDVKYAYPCFSMTDKNGTIKFLNECGMKAEIYDKDGDYDFFMNNPNFKLILELNNLVGKKSTERVLSEMIMRTLYQDTDKFISFFTGYWLADGSYTSGTIVYSSSNLILLEQLRKVLLARGIYSHIKIDKNGRNYKGKIKGDMYALVLISISDNLFNCLQIVQHLKNCKPLQLKSSYYGKGTSQRGNIQITRKQNLAHIHNIKPVKIQSQEELHYNGYVYDLAFPSTQNFFANGVLVHNTDSIFINIPMKDADQLSVEDRWKLAEHNADKINELIVEYVTGTLLPRGNIDPKFNRTFFKTEMLIDNALFLDVKKNYAYKLACKEGVVLDPPKVKYTGIQVVKSDAAKLTQDLLKSMIENVMLNEKIKKIDRIKELAQIVNQFKETFNNHVNNFQFHDIGFPGKWAKRDMFIDGMKIYNFLIGEEIFNLGSSGKFIHCRFNNQAVLRSAGTPEMKSPGICVPYEYDVNTITERMKQHQIYVDPKVHWDKLFTTACRRIVELAKVEAKNLSSVI